MPRLNRQSRFGPLAVGRAGRLVGIGVEDGPNGREEDGRGAGAEPLAGRPVARAAVGFGQPDGDIDEHPPGVSLAGEVPDGVEVRDDSHAEAVAGDGAHPAGPTAVDADRGGNASLWHGPSYVVEREKSSGFRSRAPRPTSADRNRGVR